MFKNPSFLFDIICTAAWIILVVRYARKGFLSSIVQLVGNLFSLLGAKELSAACAGWVFEHMLAGGFRTQIAANIAAGGAVDLSGIAEKYAGFLPASFRASIVAACERSIGAVLADNAVVLADSIVENVLQPLLTPVITLVLFFLFYALLRLLVSMLVTVLGLVNKLPVIGTVNRGLGWLVGGATALLDIYLVLCILWGIIVITGGNLNVLNDTVMSSSLYYKIFNLFNPFLVKVLHKGGTMVCIRCQKRPAIIFIQRMDNGQMKQEGYCLHCARELHIKPVDDLMKQFGMSDQDLDNMENRMESMMEEMGDANPLSMMMNMANGGEDADPDSMDEDLIPGSNATFPLGFTSSEKKDGDKKADRKNGKKPPKRKFLDTYCENLTRKARKASWTISLAATAKFTAPSRF